MNVTRVKTRKMTVFAKMRLKGIAPHITAASSTYSVVDFLGAESVL
jgi:hypothetical protein